MSLLSVIQAVCPVVGVVIPTSVFTNIINNRTMQEMVALANEMARRITYDTRDWTRFRAVQTLTGDGVTSAFPLPVDYKRLLVTSNIWRSTNRMTPMRFVPDTDMWLQRRNLNIVDPYGEWTMMGGNLNVLPVMGTGVTANFAYLTKNCIALNSGGFGDTFVNDADSFVLDERLLTLGMIWQWKAQKGSPYAEDLGNYGDALTMAMGHDVPAPILIGRKPMSLAAKQAYPFPVGPDLVLTRW